MDKPTCSIDECPKPGTASRGWCWTHYGRFRRWGDPNRLFEQKACSVDECAQDSRAGGMCDMHYRRWLTYGDPSVRLLHDNSGTCSHEGCGEQAARLGLCGPHYWRQYLQRPEAAQKHHGRGHARRARLASGTLETESSLTWRTLTSHGETACYLCGEACNPEDYRTIVDRRGSIRRIPGDTYPSLDHVVPLARGGTHTRANARLCHMRCNRRKHVSEPASCEWAQTQPA